MRHQVLSRFSVALCLAMISTSYPSLARAAPVPHNSIQQVLEKACIDTPCAEGYRVKFKAINFEANKQQVTVFATLWPGQAIDYPIINEKYEAQLVQSSFATVCKIRGIDEVLTKQDNQDEGKINEDFKAGLTACLTALSDRTEKALGRSN